MAVAFRGRTELSPGRTKVWVEQPRLGGKALVVYYLSRNGHLEHPHFMEVPLSSAEGLYLRDVIGRLSALRGPAMAGMHSWSSKRRYRNGFVWHDLSEDDLIHPVHGNEYVLKGTELLHLSSSSSSSSSVVSHGSTTSSSTSCEKSLEVRTRAARSSSAASEYKVYMAHTKATDTTANSTDASTQTDEHRRHRRWAPLADKKPNPAVAELSRDEISPPPSSSSSEETLEALIKANDGGGRIVAAAAGQEDKNREGGGCLSGRLRAPAMLMHLISCGSISVKANGFSLMPQYMGGLDRAESMGRMPSFRGVRADDKEFFSGSLVETTKTASAGNGNGGELPSLNRSSSYSADRSLKMDMGKEMEEVRARCMPRRPKPRREHKAEK